MEQPTPLSETRRVALEKLTAAVGPEYVEFLVSQGPDVLNASLESFMRFETSLLGQIQDKMASAIPTRFMSEPDEEAKTRPVKLDVRHYSGKEGEKLVLWIREVEMVMKSDMISVEHQRVSLEVNKLDGSANEWALMCGTSVDMAFQTWESLKLQLTRVFTPPNQAYRVRSRFLSTRQGKNELSDYVQELRTLIADMQINPLPEVVHVTVFMEGLRTGVARTEFFRVHLSSFDEAADISQNAEHNFKSARLGWDGYKPSSARASSMNTSAFCKPDPMDLSNAEGEEEADLQVSDQYRDIRRCYLSGSISHLRPRCPLRKQRQAHMSRVPATNQKPGMARGNVKSQ